MLINKSLQIPFYLHELFDRALLTSPSKIAFIFEKQGHTFQQVVGDGEKIAGKLFSEGVRLGDRVIVSANNNIHYPSIIYAVSKLGAILIPISNKLKGTRLKFILKDSSPSVIITDSEAIKKSAEENHKVLNLLAIHSATGNLNVPVNNQLIDLDPAIIIYSSGSTGNPKGISLSHSNIISAIESISRYLEINENSKILNCNPFYFDYGLYQILITAVRCSTLFIEKDFRFVGSILSKIENENITCLPLVPEHIRILTKGNIEKKYRSIIKITNTGAPFPLECSNTLLSLFPNAQIFSMYGLTECKRVSYLEPGKFSVKPNSVGQAMPNTRVFLTKKDKDSIGELVVEGRNVMIGYWNNSLETNSKIKYENSRRFLYTGDYFKMDNDSDLLFYGRRDDIIKREGIRISTKDIEQIILENEFITNVAVAHANINKKQIVVAFIVSKNSRINKEMVINHIRSNSESSAFIPDDIEFVEEIPLNDNGKVNYNLLTKDLLKRN